MSITDFLLKKAEIPIHEMKAMLLFIYKHYNVIVLFGALKNLFYFVIAINSYS